MRSVKAGRALDMVTSAVRSVVRYNRVAIPALVGGVAMLGLTTLSASHAHAQFVQGSALVPGPAAANFPLWGTIASPASGVFKVDDGFDFAAGGNSGANFARVWISIGTQLGGNTPVSPSDTIQYVFIRMDHKGVPEEGSNYNMQLNLGGAPVGRVDNLLSLRPVFSGPNRPLTGRVRIALKRYAVDASGDFPLLGAFTTNSFVGGSLVDNVGATAAGTAIGWEGVATDGLNGFEVRIPVGWFGGDVTRLVQSNGSGASSVVAALFSSGGSFGAVATVLDKFADASGNNVLINVSTTTGAHSTIVGTTLAYGVQPAAANAGTTLGAFTVRQQNSDATLVVGGTASVALAIASGPVGGTISGTTTRAASSGLATFNDISFSTPGTYTLTATSTGLLSATSSSFVISATTASAPTITSITPSNGQLSVAFTAPVSDGGSAITTYQYSTNNGSSWTTRATGTTASPLVITGLTNGTTYTVRVRAVNGVGNGAQSNSLTGTPDVAIAPSNSVAPAITGTTTVGQTLTTSTGTWLGAPTPTYTYQWQRCDAAGNNCASVGGATASTYALVTADTGSTMRAVVTGTNASGTASGTSPQTAAIAQPPANTVVPTISGSAVAGQLLTAAVGTWTGSPMPTYTYQWERCDTSGAACANIGSATASTYTLAGGDVGSTVRVSVTGTNASGTAAATAVQTATVAAAPAAPVNTVAPAITGTTTVGQIVTATTGTWTGTPAPTFGYQWQRCDLAGNNCASIAGETATTYTLTTTDAGTTLRVAVTGTNATGSVTGTSAQTAAIAQPPANTVLPTIGGTTTVGQLLTAGAGTWTGYPTPALTYQWQRCDTTGASCVAITGATASSYTLASGDAGTTIRVVETGTNSAGTASVTSTQSSTIASAPAAPAAPVNTVAPSITGTTTVGQLLTGTTGTWTGAPAPSYAYQWRRCDAAGNNCANIVSATASSYTLTSPDAGATIRLDVTGTNASGSASGTSTQTAVVAQAPANTVLPTISGSAVAGQLLTAAIGTWTGTPTPTYTYQWERCDTTGAACANIASATASTYTLAGADIGSTVRVAVTGTNAVGTAAATAVQTATVAAAPAAPVNTVAPAITGTTTVGQIVTATTGTWTGTPAPTFGYQWQRCDLAGNNCASIAGETATTYTLTTTDAGTTLRVAVTGTNASGSATGTSAQTAAIAQPPANTVLPTIGGTTTVGQLLTTTAGTWTGYPAPTLGYQWQRCDSTGASCVAITGATASSYTLASGDAGATIRVVETGTSSAGTAFVTSTQSATIAAAPAAPANTVAPGVSGTTTVGQLLTGTTGTWTGTPAPSYTYQWRRCDAAGNNCANIGTATASSYTLTSADAGTTIRLDVTGTNASGSASGTSTQTAVVAQAPANTVLPTISGSAVSGQLLTAAVGSWTGTPTPTYTYQWERCDTTGAACANIASATASTYTLAGADVGSTVRVAVTGTNAVGTAAATAVQTATVTAAPATPAAPVNTVAPAITGTTTVGQIVTATTGTWTGTPAPTFGYQWQRCDLAGNNCASIAGETATTYTLTTTDAGTTLRVAVTGTNATGSAAGTSAQTAAIAQPPANTVAPTISGAAIQGQQLTAAVGTWTGYTAPIYTYQWLRCDALGAACSIIASATASTYTPVGADVGSTTRVSVTGTNGVGAASAVATQTALVVAGPAAPVATAPPTIAGTTTVGQILTLTPGTWTGNPLPTLTHQWQRCDLAGASCVNISGETASTYTLSTADAGSTMRVVETGTNASGASSTSSTQTTAVNLAPVNTALPAITGTTTAGQSLSASTGTWTGYPAPTYSYQWQRCDAAGNNCAPIASATASSYLLTSGDVGATLRTVVTGTNVVGAASASTSQSALIAAASASPVNTVAPSITGTTTVGQIVTATTGTWTGTPAPTFGYQWQRCDLAGNNCASIMGETAATYTLTTTDAGTTLRVAVTGTNATGSATGTSAQTAAIAQPPANTVLPTIGGTTTVGQLLTVGAGTWTGYPAPTLTYQWQRCDTTGASCVAITGATASSYTLASADAGATIRIVETGTNSAGTASVTATQSSTIAAAPAAPAAPVNTVAASITGTTTVGQLLTAATGTWTGTPAPSYTYQWQRCDAAGASCANISGATASTYTLTGTDAGTTIRVDVTGTNASGSATSTSAQTAVVAQPPANTVVPTITGSAVAGQLLTAAVGSWTGTPTPTYTYQWERCDTSGAACTNIAGATASTYTLTNSDIGSTVRVSVTGTNTVGTASATAVQSATVAAATASPVNTVAPAITGTPIVGQILTVTPGTWTGTPAPTLGHQWQRCDASGNNCSAISGATGTGYTLVTADSASTIRVVETGTNGAGTSTSTSTQTAPVQLAPANVVIPTVTGTTTTGQTLTATPGTWTGYPTPIFTYQWVRCDLAGNNCATISGATSSTYPLSASDAAMTVRVAITGTNAAGSATAQSTQSAPIAAASVMPASTAVPTITGLTVEGQTLSATPGTWTGAPIPTLTSEWLRCNAAGNSCIVVPGATAGSYPLTASDVGSTIRHRVTGSNASGSAAATSAPSAVVTALPAPPPVLTPPVLVTPPTISGPVAIGSPLTASSGTFAGFPAPAITTQWQRCDANGANCIDIAGATGATYIPTPADEGKSIRVRSTGTNGSGAASGTSGASVVVPSPRQPAITGESQAGSPLTADPGTWADTSALGYQWQRCDASGNNCTDIPGATGKTYTPGDADAGGTVQVVVSAPGTGGTRTVKSGVIGARKPTAIGSKVYAPIFGGMGTGIGPTGSAPADSVPADGSRFALIRIELFDAAGAPITRRAGSDFTITINGVGVATTVRETATPGIYEIELRSTTVNQVTLGVSIDGVALRDQAIVRFVMATANLDIQLTASSETPAVGETVVFTVEVKNPGPNAATGVEVEHKLSERVRFVSSSATRGQYDATRGIWNIGGLALGESASMKVTVTVIK